MNILDENILESQRQLLRSWRVRVVQIGYDLSRKGITDEEIIPFLLEQRRPTFFTRDLLLRAQIVPLAVCFGLPGGRAV